MKLGLVCRQARRSGQRASSTAVELHALTTEPKEKRPLPPFIVVHGMLGNCNNWRSISRGLADETGRTVHSVDLRNHGSSPHSNVMSIEAMGTDLLHFIETRTKEKRAVIIGHSLGGKAAMNAALQNPASFTGVVIADIAPVNYYQLKGKATSHSLSYLRYLLEIDLSTLKRQEDADAFLEEKGVEFKAIRQFLLTNLRRDQAAKTWTWRANLPVLEESLANGDLINFDKSGLPADASCPVPSLVITGGRSPYVDLKRDGPAFDRLFPNNQKRTMPNVGHWLHAENPAEFQRLVLEWLRDFVVPYEN
eukprot:gene1607-2405_t